MYCLPKKRLLGVLDHHERCTTILQNIGKYVLIDMD